MLCVEKNSSLEIAIRPLPYRMPVRRAQYVINIIETLQDERENPNFQQRLYQRHCEILKEKVMSLVEYPNFEIRNCYKKFLIELCISLKQTKKSDWIRKNHYIREIIKNINIFLSRAKQEYRN